MDKVRQLSNPTKRTRMEKSAIPTLIKRDYERMKGVDAFLIDCAEYASRYYPMGIPRDGGVRTEAEQLALYKKKKSQKTGAPGDTSKHQAAPHDGLGKALDYYAIIDGKPSWDKDALWNIFLKMSERAKQLGRKLRSGADWNMNGIRVDNDPAEKFYDGGHVEM